MPQPSMRPLAGASGSGLTGQDALYRKVLLRLLPLLVIVYIIAYIDRSNVGFAKLGFMKDPASRTPSSGSVPACSMPAT